MVERSWIIILSELSFSLPQVTSISHDFPQKGGQSGIFRFGLALDKRAETSVSNFSVENHSTVINKPLRPH